MEKNKEFYVPSIGLREEDVYRYSIFTGKKNAKEIEEFSFKSTKISGNNVLELAQHFIGRFPIDRLHKNEVL